MLQPGSCVIGLAIESVDQIAEPLLQAAAQLHGETLSRAFADARSLGQTAQIGLNDRRNERPRRQLAQQGKAHLGTHAADGHQLAEQIPFAAFGKSVQRPAVIADDVVDVQGEPGALRRQLSKLAAAELDLVTHTGHHQHHAKPVGLLPRILNLPLQPTDHRRPFTAPMLPALPSPGSWQPWRVLRQLAVLALLLLLPLGLAGCGPGGTPTQATVQSALALQIELTQGAIAAALDLPPAGTPRVRHVRIERRSGVRIGAGQGLRLEGHFDWQLANDPVKVDSPFEIYLQRGERGQSWRLARPSSGDAEGLAQQWLIDPLPIRS